MRRKGREFLSWGLRRKGTKKGNAIGGGGHLGKKSSLQLISLKLQTTVHVPRLGDISIEALALTKG